MDTCTLRIAFPDAAGAARAATSLAPDNGDFLRCRVDGNVLMLEASADSPLGLLRTLEDAFNALRATGLK